MRSLVSAFDCKCLVAYLSRQIHDVSADCRLSGINMTYTHVARSAQDTYAAQLTRTLYKQNTHAHTYTHTAKDNVEMLLESLARRQFLHLLLLFG